MEKEHSEDIYAIAEVAGFVPDPQPMTEAQEVRLTLLDRQMEEWFTHMEEEKAKKDLQQQAFIDYMYRNKNIDDI